MERGAILINKDYEFEFRYYDRDPKYKYYNRRFEILLLEKKTLKKNYVLHMDNSDVKDMTPHVYKLNLKKKYDFGVTTLNWNDIKTNFLNFVASEIGEKDRENARKALSKISSPKI